jgi:tetratricopeptide (TPR) repeat protein
MPVVERTKLSDLLGPAYRHLAAGEIEAARSLLEQGLQQYPETGLLRLLAARIAEMEGRTGEAASLFHDAAAALRAEAARLPKNPALALALAQALLNCGEANAAAAALASAKDHRAAPADALRIERILAWNAKDWQWLRRAAGQLIAVEANPTAQDLMMLAAACRNLDDPDGVTTAAGRARAIDREASRPRPCWPGRRRKEAIWKRRSRATAIWPSWRPTTPDGRWRPSG